MDTTDDELLVGASGSPRSTTTTGDRDGNARLIPFE